MSSVDSRLNSISIDNRYDKLQPLTGQDILRSRSFFSRIALACQGKGWVNRHRLQKIFAYANRYNLKRLSEEFHSILDEENLTKKQQHKLEKMVKTIDFFLHPLEPVKKLSLEEIVSFAIDENGEDEEAKDKIIGNLLIWLELCFHDSRIGILIGGMAFEDFCDLPESASYDKIEFLSSFNSKLEGLSYEQKEALKDSFLEHLEKHVNKLDLQRKAAKTNYLVVLLNLAKKK